LFFFVIFFCYSSFGRLTRLSLKHHIWYYIVSSAPPSSPGIIMPGKPGNFVRLTINHLVTDQRQDININSGKHNVTVWRPSVRLSRRHTHRDSPGRSTRRGQRTFMPDNKEDGHGCWSKEGA